MGCRLQPWSAISTPPAQMLAGQPPLPVAPQPLQATADLAGEGALEIPATQVGFSHLLKPSALTSKIPYSRLIESVCWHAECPHFGKGNAAAWQSNTKPP